MRELLVVVLFVLVVGSVSGDNLLEEEKRAPFAGMRGRRDGGDQEQVIKIINNKIISFKLVRSA